MKIVDNKQTWKGFFTYQDGYEVIDQYIEVAFTMELTFNDNSFTGFSTDAESENYFKEPTSVKGFIEGYKISFVLNYPCLYYKDENGNIVLDRKEKHPEIHYLGFFDEIRKCFSGTWEMIVYEEKYFDDYIAEIMSGEFEIKRVR